VLIVLLFATIGFMTAYPVGQIFINSFRVTRPGETASWGLQGWQTAFSDPSIFLALGNTFVLASVRTAISVGLAIFFAWVITRTDTPFKGFIEFMLWLGYFFPTLPMTMGWILLLDPDYGLINKFLQGVFHLASSPFNIYSYSGIIWAHLAYSTCIRFLLITPAFRTMDAALEDAARTSGSSDVGTLLRITIPIMAPTLLAVTALGFIKSLESFEIELILGIPARIYVYSTKVWEYLHWEPPRYDVSTALSGFFLLIIFALVWLQRVFLGARQYTTITGRGYSPRPARLGQWRWATCAACLLFIAVMIVLPLSFLVMGTFMRLFGFFNLQDAWTSRHWQQAFDDPIFVNSLRNTLILGVGAALTGAIFYTVISYLLIRAQFAGKRILDLLCWLPWALPGVLISLALLWVFVGSGKFLLALHGTVYILVLAIIISELPLGTQVLKANVMQLSKELEESAWVAGAPWFHSFRHIVVPLLMPSLISVALIIFISAIREISAVIFLASARSRTLSLLMLDYMAANEYEKATVMAVFIVGLVLIAAAIARAYGLRLGVSRG
jgi:iron(III) transport system permease protein